MAPKGKKVQEKDKKWRQDRANLAKREGNLTDMETEAFGEILVDGEFAFFLHSWIHSAEETKESIAIRNQLEIALEEIAWEEIALEDLKRYRKITKLNHLRQK